MPGVSQEIKVSLQEIKQAAEAASISVDKLQSALVRLKPPTGRETGFGIRMYGMDEAEVARSSRLYKEVTMGAVQGVAQLTKAYGAEADSIKITSAVYDNYMKQLRLTLEYHKQITAQIAGGGTTQVSMVAALPEMVIPMKGAAEYSAVAQEMIDKLGGGARGLEKATALSEKYGFTLNNLTRAHTDAVNGVTRFTYAVDHGAGVTRGASVHIDRLGNALADTSTRFRNTTAMIERNIGKVMEWAVAVGVVYGGIRKIQTVLQDMKEIEYTFADIAIVTGEAGEALDRYYQAAVVVAHETSMELNDVVSIYDDVLRATANVADESERLAIANTLLHDSAVLAKLANISSAQSYDILLGALRQSHMELDQGMVLLDKWVAVSKSAGVSVNDMGQSFAITADIMRAAGVDTDKLNGLIATLAETTTLSSTQIGNALRALASTATTERSIDVLGRYGIAVKDLEGNYRDLWDILLQISAMYETGVLNESQLKAIAEAMGGGQRRAAQLITLITNMPKAMESAAVSANAQGDAMDALAIKTDTLQSALVNLGTAWQDLAKTVGVEGGLLSSLTELVEGLTNVLDLVTGLTEALGPLTTSLVTFGIAWSALGFFGGTAMMGGLAGRIGGLATMAPVGAALTMFQPGAGGRGGTGRWQNIATGRYTSEGFVREEVAVAAGSQRLGSAVGWLRDPRNLTGVFTVAAIAAAPLLTEGFTRESVTKVVGSGIGAAFGWAVGGPIGGIIGSVIGQAFVDTVMRSRQLLTTPLRELTTEQLEERLKLRETVGVGRYADRYGGADEGEIRDIKAVLEEREAAVKEGLDEEVNYHMQIMEEIAALERQLSSKLVPVYQTRFELLKKYAAGEITLKQFNDQVEAAERTSTMIVAFYRYMSDEIEADIEEMGEVMRNASIPTLIEMGARVAELESLDAQLLEVNERINQNLDKRLSVLVKINAERREILKAVESLKDESELIYGLMQRESALPVPQFMKFDISTTELEQYIQDAMRLMEQFAAAAGIEMASMWEDAFYYAFTDGVWTKIGPEVNRTMLQWAIGFGEDAGKEVQFNLDRLRDISPGQFEQFIEPRTRYWEEFFRRIGKPLEQEEINLILGPENTLKQLFASQDALRYALDDLREVEEKRMLEGMWNIPPGATFMVPITSLFYQRMGGEAGAGEPPLPGMPAGGYPATGGGRALTAESIGAANFQALHPDLSSIRAALESPQYLQTIAEMYAPWLEKVGMATVGPALETSEYKETLEQMYAPWLAEVTAMQPSEISVEIPPISARFEIENVIYLDGRVIKEYVNMVLAEDLRRSTRGGVNPAAANAPITGWYA